MEIQQIGYILSGDEGIDCSLSSCSGCATGTMNEELRGWWKIMMDDVLDLWQINASGCYIRHQQHINYTIPELGHLNLPCRLKTLLSVQNQKATTPMD